MKIFMRAFLILMVLSMAAAGPAPAADKPNIVLVFMENFGWGDRVIVNYALWCLGERWKIQQGIADESTDGSETR